MKFDMGQAWSQAMVTLGANRDLIGIVAGVFFFLPYLALMLMVPDLSAEMPVAQPGVDPQAMYEALMAVYGRIWPYVLIVVILQGIGSLSLLALLRDSTRPTLGEALKLGLIAFLPYIVAQLLMGAGIGLAAVRQVVEEHGGRVSIESQEGVGSTFTVRLPLGLERHESEPEAAAGSLSSPIRSAAVLSHEPTHAVAGYNSALRRRGNGARPGWAGCPRR